MVLAACMFAGCQWQDGPDPHPHPHCQPASLMSVSLALEELMSESHAALLPHAAAAAPLGPVRCLGRKHWGTVMQCKNEWRLRGEMPSAACKHYLASGSCSGSCHHVMLLETWTVGCTCLAMRASCLPGPQAEQPAGKAACLAAVLQQRPQALSWALYKGCWQGLCQMRKLQQLVGRIQGKQTGAVACGLDALQAVRQRPHLHCAVARCHGSLHQGHSPHQVGMMTHAAACNQSKTVAVQ